MAKAGIFTRKHVGLITLVAYVVLLLPLHAFAEEEINTSEDAAKAIGQLDRITLGERFPSALQGTISSNPADNQLNAQELKGFDAAFKTHVMALEKVGFLNQKKFLVCWEQNKGTYLNRSAVREFHDMSTGELIGFLWLDCLRKDPEPRNLNDWIANLVDNGLVAGVAGAAATAGLYLLSQVLRSVRQAVEISLLGDLVRAFTEPVMGPMREFTGLQGRTVLKTPAVKVANFFANQISKGQKKIERLERAKGMLGEASKIIDDNTLPGLSPAQLEQNFQKFNKLFIDAVQMWNTTLAPNSQLGRGIVMDGTIFRPKTFTGDLALYQTKLELYRQGIAADLPKSISSTDAAIAAAQSDANDKVQKILAGNQPGKENLVQAIHEARDQKIKILAAQKQAIIDGMNEILENAAALDRLRQGAVQDSNIYFVQAGRILAGKEVDADVALDLVNSLQQIRDQEISSGKATDAVASQAQELLAKLKIKKDLLKDVLNKEAEARATALESIHRLDQSIADKVRLLVGFGVSPNLMEDLLARQKEMLIARRQAVAVIAGKLLHDQMYPELNRNLPPDAERALKAFQKEIGFNHFEQEMRVEVQKLIREMGFEIGQEAPTLEKLVDELSQKIDDDITTVTKRTIAASNLGVRDRLRYLFKLESQLGAETKLAETAASAISCQDGFNGLK